jgi:TRAP-type mannitol/chloroaromatic compound transport system permease large subunit
MPFTEILAILMLVSFFAMLMAGMPVGLTLAVSGIRLRLSRLRAAAVQPPAAPHLRRGDQPTLLAIPLFVFMGVMLEKSRLAEDLMDVIGHARGFAARRPRASASSWSAC